MSSDRRQQEQREGTEPTGLAWFELYEILAEYGHAEAYPTRYDRANTKWIRDTFSPKRTVYSLIAGVTGQVGDFVLCLFNPTTRKWEVTNNSVGGVEFHRGVTNGTNTKGSFGNVDRYQAGTTTLTSPLVTDVVYNDFATVATAKKVAYLKDGAKFYIIAAEC